MAGRVREDPPPGTARLMVRLAGAHFEQPGLGSVQVLDREVEVELLRNRLVGPARSLVVDPLEAEESPFSSVSPANSASDFGCGSRPVACS